MARATQRRGFLMALAAVGVGTAGVGCGSPCPRHGTDAFFAVLAVRPGDGGSCPSTLSGTVVFTSDETATIQAGDQPAGPCSVVYTEFSNSTCEIRLTCEAGVTAGEPASLRGQIDYASSQTVLEDDTGLGLTLVDGGVFVEPACVYGWSLTP